VKRVNNPQHGNWGGIYDRNPRIVGLFGYLRIRRRARLKPLLRIHNGMRAYFDQRERNDREQRKAPMSKVRRGSPLPRHGM
jgi:hypothetical protein